MITLTSQAILKIKEKIAARGSGVGIKIAVKPSGCSGYKYVLEFVDQRNSWDDEHQYHGVTVFTELKDFKYLDGLILDYVRQGLNEGFEFTNPNESSRCGCGESFTI